MSDWMFARCASRRTAGTGGASGRWDPGRDRGDALEGIRWEGVLSPVVDNLADLDVSSLKSLFVGLAADSTAQARRISAKTLDEIERFNVVFIATDCAASNPLSCTLRVKAALGHGWR